MRASLGKLDWLIRKTFSLRIVQTELVFFFSFSKDIKRAFRTLKVFGDGCGVVEAGAKKSLEDSLVYCVPEELGEDSAHILSIAAGNPRRYIRIEDLEKLGRSP